MRKPLWFVLTVGIVMSAAVPARGQKDQTRGPVRGGPNPFIMLRHAAVQEELKFTPEQKEKLKKLMETLRDRMIALVENNERDKIGSVMREQEKQLPTILTAAQLKRLREVFLQVQGLWAMSDPGVVKDLQITKEQGKKILELQREQSEQMKKLFGQDGAATRTEAQKKLAEFHQQANAKGLALLTDEQRAKWKTMIGEPFTREIRRVVPMGR